MASSPRSPRPPRPSRSGDLPNTTRAAFAQGLVREVGTLLLRSFRTGVAAERKSRGIVTRLDREAESLIAEALAATFPGDGLVSEEGTERPSSTGWRWIADPLDGTTNFVSGLPMFAVSLAAVNEQEGSGAAIGVVHAPALGTARPQTALPGSPPVGTAPRRSAPPGSALPGSAPPGTTFVAERGRGARGDGGPLRASPATDLGDAVFLINKAYAPPAHLWEVTAGLLPAIRAARMFGCVSLDLALVAAGWVDGAVLLPADPWDIAAGVLLVVEAGGRVTDHQGAELRDGERSAVLAAAPGLHAEALTKLRP